MAKQHVMFTFSEEALKEPIIYNLSQQFNLITNIRNADLSGDKGWIKLELQGEKEDIEQGLAWATSMGVRVDPATANDLEG